MSDTSVTLAPLIPLWLLALLAGFCLLGVGISFWRRLTGGVWRAAFLLLMLVGLLNPTLVHELREPIKDIAVIVIDQSPSQKIGDRMMRTEKAVTALQTSLAAFPDIETRIVRSADGDGALEETHLLETLSRAVADLPRRRIAAAILVTEGQVHDVGEAMPGLVGFAPIHTLLTGLQREGDRRLSIRNAPTYGLVGKTVTVTVRVDDLPGAKSGETLVRIRPDGQEGWSAPISIGRDVPLTFTLAHGGLNVIELEVGAGPEELTLANNRAAIVVNGVRDRLRVLLVSGEPHAGERTWRNLLKADPAVDLVHFTILRPPEKLDNTSIRELSLIAFPIRELFEVKLDEFDLIIFDRYRRRNVLPNQYLANIADYVEKGGAFLEASGPTFATPMSLYRTPLGAVLPGEPTGDIIERGFVPKITDTGLRHPVTSGLSRRLLDPGALTPADANNASWGRWFRQIAVTSNRGMTVMSGADARPLLILDRVGEGRVAQLTSDQIWLWSRGFDGGGPQAELLRRLAHWLMKEPELEENNLKARVEGSRITVERRSLEPDTRPITARSPSDTTSPVPMSAEDGGIETGMVVADAPGIWRFTDGERTALAVVGTVNPPELADMRTTADLLAPVTKATGGGVWWLSDLDLGRDAPDLRRVSPQASAVGGNWMGLRSNGDHVVTGVSQLPLLPGWVLLLLAVSLAMLAWRVEGK